MKLDGTTSVATRQPLIDKFNRSEDIFLFILTTRVSLGFVYPPHKGRSRVRVFTSRVGPRVRILFTWLGPGLANP